MKLEWIDDILAVHDTGSLRAAADIRFVTASAFTRRIKAVESTIGCELFDRSNKPVTLRPHVAQLIPRMREASANLRVIRNELSGAADNGRITQLICQHTLSVSWAPKVVRALSQNTTQLRVRSGSKDECSFSLLKNETDIALVYEETDSKAGQDDDLFDRLYLDQEEFLPVAALENNDELNEAINRKRIPLVSYPRKIFLGEVLEKALLNNSESNMSYFTIAESGLGPAVMEFVREGLGAGWLPSSLIQREIQTGEFTAMTPHLPSFKLNIVALCSTRSELSHTSQAWKTIESTFGTTRA